LTLTAFLLGATFVGCLGLLGYTKQPYFVYLVFGLVLVQEFLILKGVKRLRKRFPGFFNRFAAVPAVVAVEKTSEKTPLTSMTNVSEKQSSLV
jgi:hypothetical protein